MQIQNQTICIGCGEAITNPVCPSCLDRDIAEWGKTKGIKIGVKPLRNELGYTDYDGTTCIKCGDVMHLCPYCYTENVFKWLKNNRPRAAGEFLQFFSFDLGGRGYSRRQEVDEEEFNSKLQTV